MFIVPLFVIIKFRNNSNVLLKKKQNKQTKKPNKNHELKKRMFMLWNASQQLKKITSDIFNYLDGSQGHYAEWEKQTIKCYILHDFIYITFSK